MNKFSINTLKILRKGFSKIFQRQNIKPVSEQDPGIASGIIFKALTSDTPCMIARFGSTEMTCLINYIGVKNQKNQFVNFVLGKTPPWWWESSIINQMQQWSGFFPPEVSQIEKFCELMLQDLKEVDVLGSWLVGEKYFENELDSCSKIRLTLCDPYWSSNPWTRALEGKKVLVLHPFAETIKSQYKKRQLLFDNNLLPKFDLETIKAVQSIAGEKTLYKDWFEALDYMKSEINERDYDVCLIGAGAYGFPLAAHVKRMGKKAFHIGGSLQLLFGIRGRRWETNYSEDFDYLSLVNEHWVKPSLAEKPANADNVEDSCYW